MNCVWGCCCCCCCLVGVWGGFEEVLGLRGEGGTAAFWEFSWLPDVEEIPEEILLRSLVCCFLREVDLKIVPQSSLLSTLKFVELFKYSNGLRNTSELRLLCLWSKTLIITFDLFSICIQKGFTYVALKTSLHNIHILESTVQYHIYINTWKLIPLWFPLTS